MNSIEARDAILRHALHADTPDAAVGFLGSLRPYRGRLIEANYHELMSALKVIAPNLTAQSVDREIMSALWDICFLATNWVHPKGILGRNNLLSESETDRLSEWIEDFGYAVAVLLGGGDVADAFEPYENKKRA